jgi:serine/threonine-protein kinase
VSSTARQQAEARLGTVLAGKWMLDSFLGYGGSAAVYGATHRNGKRAAVKILHAHCAASPDLVSRFVREGYLANKIRHPGVVSVIDDDTSEAGLVYLVMELLEGRSFERHGRGAAAPLTIPEALRVADDLLDILVAAHAIGLVHRDIKPANLFLTTAGELKILDFGIARLAEPTVEGATQTGMLMGTPAFMPPEQARGRWQDVDARSDLWAVGVTLATLLTGRRPRVAETPAEELLAAMMQPMPSLAAHLPDAPPAVVALIDKAYAFERESRWQTAAEMQAAVREVRSGLKETGQLGPEPTLLFAPDTSPPVPAHGDGTPPPGMRFVPSSFAGGTLVTPAGARPSTVPELSPSLTTNGAMMQSAPPAASRRPMAALVAASLGVLLLGGALVGGLTLLRRTRPRSAGLVAATATTATAASSAATTADHAGAPTSPDPPATPSDPGPPTGAPSADPTTVVPEDPGGRAASTASAGKPGARLPKPKPKPAAEGSADPARYFDQRF